MKLPATHRVRNQHQVAKAAIRHTWSRTCSARSTEVRSGEIERSLTKIDSEPHDGVTKCAVEHVALLARDECRAFLAQNRVRLQNEKREEMT